MNSGLNWDLLLPLFSLRLNKHEDCHLSFWSKDPGPGPDLYRGYFPVDSRDRGI